mmetsp:Transcript_36105/g.80341  ORF Transcript_36105/g.80341 Transcript_36105/m.80341 type:complete len:81 (+) Transcript_36105:313-555(+)
MVPAPRVAPAPTAEPVVGGRSVLLLHPHLPPHVGKQGVRLVIRQQYLPLSQNLQGSSSSNRSSRNQAVLPHAVQLAVAAL